MLELDVKSLLINDVVQELNEVFPIKRAAIYCSEKFEVHADGYYEAGVRYPARCGVNYILSGEGALRWFIPGLQIEDRQGTFIYSGYKKEIDCWEHMQGDWALVNAEIAHSPMVYKSQRAVISFRNKDISFEEAKERLRWLIIS